MDRQTDIHSATARSPGSRRRHRTARCLYLITVLALGAATARGEPPQHYDIPAQPLNDALLQLAAAAGLELVFDADRIRGLGAEAVAGRMTAEQALQQLLRNSGYAYRFLDRRTVTLVPSPRSGPPVAATPETTPPLEQPVKVLGPLVVVGQRSRLQQEARRSDYRVTSILSATRTDTPLREIPQSVQALPRQLLDDQQNLTIGESLRNVSGVTVAPAVLTPSFDFTRIRGFRAEQLLDGFTQYYNPGDRESLVNVERIEVLKGANGLLYGGGSGSPAGGLVNIVSKLPHAGAEYEVGIKYGSYHYVQPWLDINQPLSDNIRLRFTGEFTSADSHVDVVETRRFNLNPTLLISDDERTRFIVQGKVSRWRQADYQGLPAGAAAAKDFSIAPETFIGPPAITPSRAAFSAVWATLDHALNDTWSVNLKARYAESSFDQRVQLLFGGDGVQGDTPLLPPSTWALLNTELYQEQRELSFAGNTLARFDLGPSVNRLLIGADYSRYRDAGFIASDSVPVALADFAAAVTYPPYSSPRPRENRLFVANTTYGAYLQWQSSWFERIHLLGGLRLGAVLIEYRNRASTPPREDRTDKTEWLPKLGAAVDLSKGVSLFAGYSLGMRGQPFFNFSAQPQPELSRQLEAGLKFGADDFVSGQVAVYRIDREQIAVLDTGDTLRRSKTVGEQRSQGIETDLLWKAGDNWQILTSYAYTDARYLANFPNRSDGSPIAGIPRHSGRLWTNYRIVNGPFNGLAIGAGVYAQSASALDVPAVPKNAGFYNLDAAVSYRTEHATFSLSGKNLTDQRYFESLNYFGGRVYPGQPMSLYFAASLRY